jgi:hypothetical protein
MAKLADFEALVRADERGAIEDKVKTLDEPMTVRLSVINKAIRAKRKGGDYDRYESNIGYMFGDKR